MAKQLVIEISPVGDWNPGIMPIRLEIKMKIHKVAIKGKI
jgi:hypothetical protein